MRFAEVFPEDKYTVVEHLQSAGHVTGMTGDASTMPSRGARRKVGIAVSTATDVANAAQQDLPVSACGGCTHGHRSDTRGISGTHAFALDINIRDFRLG
jgi:hypothetical protein